MQIIQKLTIIGLPNTTFEIGTEKDGREIIEIREEDNSYGLKYHIYDENGRHFITVRGGGMVILEHKEIAVDDLPF